MPCTALKTTLASISRSCSTNFSGTSSTSTALYPFSRKASAIAPPVLRETSASEEGPPKTTATTSCLFIYFYAPIL